MSQTSRLQALALRLDLRLRAQRYRYRLDRAEIRALLAALSPGDCAVDIGAHKGGYLYWLQKRVGARGRVVAFEPQPDLAAYLRRAMEAIGARHAIIEGMALSDRVGTATLRLRLGRSSCGATLEARHPAGRYSTRLVPRSTLDEYVLEHPMRIRALKCDVEGHELAVFRGAAGILRDHRPTVLFECEARHLPGHSVRDVLRYLAEAGYEGWFFLHGQQRPIAEFQDEMQRTPKSPGYVNNFLFRPAGRGRGSG